MKSRALLRLVLLSLVTSLSVLAFHVAEHPGAAHAARQERSDDAPGSLTALDSKGNVAGPCPLRRTEVRAEVSGFLSRVTVTQDFHNPFEDKIEAVYTFPLPQGAAVDDMTMLVGGRTVKGKIMRREEAKATYEQAKQRGHVASLLAQQRPNVFTQSVANILPGEGVKVIISYVETLKYEGGSYEWSFPVVVGKRYMPAPAKPEGKGNAGETPAESSASSDDASGETEAAPSNSEDEQLNPPVVPEGMRAGHDISIEVALDAGVPVESISSETHEIEEERQDAGRAVVRLKNRSVIPNKDFVLRYDVAGRQITDALLAHRSARGGFFTFILQPPERVSAAEATPKELVFVLDTSGSMSGFPIEKAKETMKLALEGLHPHDTFNLITFSGDTHVLFPEPVPATPQNLDRAQRFLASRRGDGGTEMMKAIRAALDPSDSQAHVRVAVFMTDGQVGNDMEIIAEVRRHANARVFAMGFGSSPNRFLLDQMAAHGRGEVEYVTEGSDSASAARRFHERVRDPLLTDISIEWAGLPVADVYPRRTPDLFGAKPVYLSGRYTAGARGTITLRGRMAGREFSREIPVVLPEREDGRDVLATLWARRRIDELSAEEWAAAYSSGKRSEEMKKAVVNEVTQLGLDFRLMTQYTSFVAVEDGSITGGDAPRRVDVPVENTTSYAVGGAHTNGVSEYVVVTSTAEVLDSSTASLSRTVESRTVDNLPLNGRSPLGFAVLAPGVTRAGATRPRQDAPNNFSAYGQGPESNLFTVDGVSANVGIAPGGESPGPTAAGTIPALTAAGNNNALASLHTTRELTVRGFFVEPEHGRVPGLRVALNTSSGTNEFRGSLFEYFGHERTDANDFFANSRGLPRPRRSLNNFGGILGGPLKRDSTFFFASYEGLRLRQPDLALTQVPTLAARLAAPPNVRPFLEAFPLPTGAEGADGFAESARVFSNPADLDAFSLRLDHNAGSKLLLHARYHLADSDARARGAGGFSANTVQAVGGRAQSFTGSASYTISSTAVTDLRANYTRNTVRGSYRLDDFGGARVSTEPFLSDALSRPDFGFLFDLGARGAALRTGGEAASTQRQLNFVGSLSLLRGEHALKLGADYRRLSPVIGLRSFEQHVFFDGVAQALTGTAARDGRFTRTGPREPVFQNLSVYAQDEWRLSSRLTLTYGLRWELNPAPRNSDGPDAPAFTQTDDPTRLSPAAPGAPLWRTTYGNLAPRAGLAFGLDEEMRTIFRAGFGLFYDMGQSEAGDAFADSFPFLDGAARFNAPFTVADSFPVTTTGAPVVVPVSAFDPRLKLPYAWRWSLAVERAVAGNNSVGARYVGSAGRRLLSTRTLLDQSADFPFLRLTTNGAESEHHSLQFTFDRRLARGLEAHASYTLSKTHDTATQDTAARALLRADNPRLERGPSDFDARHLFSGFATYELPAPFADGLANALSRRWALDAVFHARSARPVNVLYAFPTAYGLAYLRPDLVEGAPLYLEDPTTPGGRRINPAAFSAPAGFRQGTLARNALRGFALQQLDLALRRSFNFTDSVRLTLRAEAFNLLNHPNFEEPSGTEATLGHLDPTSGTFRANSTFGQTLSAYGRSFWSGQGGGFGPFNSQGGPRTLQFSVKLAF